MSGNKKGGLKAAETNKKKDPNFYAKIGSQSWKNKRSRVTGFAKLDKEKHKEISAKGGSRKKEDYHTPKADKTSAGTGE